MPMQGVDGAAFGGRVDVAGVGGRGVGRWTFALVNENLGGAVQGLLLTMCE